MKLTVKLIFVVCLFTSVAFADGEMGSGGKNCPSGTTTCIIENQPTNTDTINTESDDSFLTFIGNYLVSIFE
jgi:hypothetical protein